MPLFLDHQHRGKPHRPNDCGAVHDLDGDGVIQRDEEEIWLTEGFLAAVTQALSDPGELIHTVWLCNGEYSERHRQAALIAGHRHYVRTGFPWLYLAGHVNSSSPPGDYGAVFYDYRSSGGKLAAKLIAAELEPFPEYTGGVRVIAARPGGDWSRAFSTLAGIYAGPPNLSGVLLEPGFLNCPSHAPLWTLEGLHRIGQAVSDGALKWLETRQLH